MHTLTAPVAYEERAPHLTVVDSIKRITMTRINQRLRVGGAGVFQSASKADKPLDATLSRRALDLLGQGTHDWIPGARASPPRARWDGLRLITADGLPIVGATRHPRLFVNAAHGPAGWGLACGSAKVVADLVSGVTPDLPAEHACRAEHRTLLATARGARAPRRARLLRSNAGFPNDPILRRLPSAAMTAARSPYFTPKDDRSRC